MLCPSRNCCVNQGSNFSKDRWHSPRPALCSKPRTAMFPQSDGGAKLCSRKAFADDGPNSFHTVAHLRQKRPSNRKTRTEATTRNARQDQRGRQRAGARARRSNVSISARTFTGGCEYLADPDQPLKHQNVLHSACNCCPRLCIWSEVAFNVLTNLQSLNTHSHGCCGV